MHINEETAIVVVGLGYVGLPLAVALARSYPTVGFDIDERRISELRQNHDRTCELETEQLRASALKLTSDPNDARGAAVYIVTVPTPVDEKNAPDLRPVLAASRSVGEMIDPNQPAIVIFESTVYPGVTEDVCGPTLEEAGNLTRGKHFWLGYSPERINPGDREHTVDRIVKVIAGENEQVVDALDTLYSKVTSGGVFRAASIKTAEAAKVIENAQRDINIAFMNEVTRIFAKIDLSIWDVLAAAGTKWNFLKFQPGLVGGHCIGVDPYYLSHLAEKVGYEPRVILAGRAINDDMGDWVAGELVAHLDDNFEGSDRSALVMGLSFKENVPDLRNSKVIDLVRGLARRGYDVTVHDPLVNPDEALREYGLTLDPDALSKRYDLAICAVAHDDYQALAGASVATLVRSGGLVGDLKGIWQDGRLPDSIQSWTL